MFPGSVFDASRVGGHVNGSSHKRDAAFATGHPVAYLTTGAGGRAVEGFNSGREIVCLGLERDHGFEVTGFKKVGLMLGARSKLLNNRSFDESYIVFVGRNKSVGMGRSSFFDESEECFGHCFVVDDKSAVEDFVPAVL